MKRRHLKLVVMIPCLNEEKTLPLVIKSIPKKIKGIKKVEILVIDDGSMDKTVRVARKHGVKRFVIHRKNQGLAKSFADGLDAALALGADIIVNTDGDNQYPQEEIRRLIEPIMTGRADIVIADRQTSKIAHFSSGKKFLQKFGSAMVCMFSGIKIPDAVSGFRAYNREAALHLNVFTDYTYTIETLIQAAKKKLQVVSVKIKTRLPSRKSRLIKSVWSYLKVSTATTIRLFAIYEPLKVFSYASLIIALPGTILLVRFIFLFFDGDAGQHIQSLIFGSMSILIGALIFLMGIIADLIAINRIKYENMLYRIKKMELKQK